MTPSEHSPQSSAFTTPTGESPVGVPLAEAGFFAEDESRFAKAQHEEQRLHRLVGAIFLTLLLTGVLLASIDNLTNFFEKDAFRVQAYFNKIGDLEAGAPVFMGGVQIGRVTKIKMQADGRILLRAALHLRRSLPIDSQMNIEATTVSGDTFVSIIRGDSSKCIEVHNGKHKIPVLRGNDFMSLGGIGELATDIADLASSLGNNLEMFHNTDSSFSKKIKELRKSAVQAKDEYEMLQQRLKKTKSIFTDASAAASKLSMQFANLEVRYKAGGLRQKLPELMRQYEEITRNREELSATIKPLGKKISDLQPQWAALATWGQGLKVAPRSLVGVLMNRQCDSLPVTFKLLKDSLTKVSDYSLVKKLRFYFDAKELYACFQKDTPQSLQLDAQELYRSWIKAARQRRACELSKFPTSCPYPAQ